MMKPVARAILLTIVVLLCSADVGSPDVWFEGPAGPYRVRVLVRPPSVVPGLADIVVDVDGASAVFVTAASGASKADGAPPPDRAQPREGRPGSYSAQLWLMARGAFRVIVRVEGDQGTGTAVIPVTAMATERKPMPWFLGAALIGGLLFLLFGLISIVGSAVRESLLAPGTPAPSANLRRARVGMAATLVVTAALLSIGWRWWGSVDRKHRDRLDHAWSATASIDTTVPARRVLHFAITDSTWLLRNDSAFQRRMRFSASWSLVPDHGKIMHLFLVREGDMAGLAHLHPTSPDDVNFFSALPPLPPGPYRVFADIVEISGITRTIVSRVDIRPPNGSPDAGSAVFSPSDADDASWQAVAGMDLNAVEQHLPGGLRFRWTGPSTFVADEPAELRGSFLDGSGAPLVLEPYMGMAGHAVVTNADGSVYVHLHPMGTISMAALEQVTGGDGPHVPEMHMTPDASKLTFPYAFPRAGQYRVWMQVKHDGRIITVAHDVQVTD